MEVAALVACQPLFFLVDVVLVSGVDARGSCCDPFSFLFGVGQVGFGSERGGGSLVAGLVEGGVGPLKTTFKILDATAMV